ncbi:OLC1v1029211C1 [Oldenlandia corymbosa var. corymbosa]|uniref:OLC1v1029211C1 n=1 Tax=Oldenlandia corymbosa var. corymbosa TaxID=529605 RepID=A0AAV1CDF9_OLDCO|nr:OLC1v1029211C1 [Oldenlandia corymbosa var. corymbosa]
MHPPSKTQGFIGLCEGKDAATLSLSCLLKGKDAQLDQGMEKMFSDLLEMIIPRAPEVVEMFIGLLEVSNPSRSDKFRVGEIVVRLVDFLQEDVADPLKHHVEMLKEGIVIMITFFMNPAKESVTDNGDGLLSRISVAVNEVLLLICSLSLDDLKVKVSYLQEKIEIANADIRKVYCPILMNSSNSSVPTTNGIGFMDFFLENLEKMVKHNPTRICFAKHQLMMIHEQFLSLKPLLHDILKMQPETGDLKLLQKQIINLVILAEHVTNSCLMIDHPIWYDLLQLSQVIHAMKLIEIEVKKCSDHQKNKTGLTSSIETHSGQVLKKQANPSSLQDVVVGWEDESKTIVDKLTRGTTQLGIVSIVGMPGLGKTTIAKKLYNDPSIEFHFHCRSWCCVSQVYNPRELYYDILTDVIGVEARQVYSSCTDNDLAEKLRRSLKQRRYLIVLDDIWDIEALNSIKLSFPDDKVGSRIMFTSRIHDLASQAKLKCSPHHLRSLSDEESWELLQLKLSHNNFSSSFDDELSEIGKNIARNCKGLPLAVGLVAGILASKDIKFWKQIEENTYSQMVSEGCLDVLELSYKHLPDNLKACFLYFGAFLNDRVVRAGKLMSLWIAEGLIPRSGDTTNSPHEVAEEYLSNLISRSLVILEERNSNGGGIKTCRVHDLLNNLCQVKIREENFLQWVNDKDVYSFPLNSSKYENYRLCIDAEWTKFVNTKPSGSFVRSLRLVGDYNLLEVYPCPSVVLDSFRRLNVLDLECIVIQGPFPRKITRMVHLRFLAIRCDAGQLPSSISNLWNLETLILKDSRYVTLPETFWLMKNLRHVHIDGLRLEGLKDHEYGELGNMEVLSTPYLNSGEETEELLRRLPGLLKLKCYFVERDSSGELFKFPELSRLTHLKSLIVENYGEVFFGVNYDQFPAFDFPSSLKELRLEVFSLPWSAISIVGQLPNLEVLKLNEAFSGIRWDVEDGEFLNLKYLELQWLDVEEWRVQDDPFPSLEVLVMTFCQNLDAIPSGLGYIPTLIKIEMRWCSDALIRSAWEIQETGNGIPEVVIRGSEFL